VGLAENYYILIWTYDAELPGVSAQGLNLVEIYAFAESAVNIEKNSNHLVGYLSNHMV
jgi:hypothetical protein